MKEEKMEAKEKAVEGIWKEAECVIVKADGMEWQLQQLRAEDKLQQVPTLGRYACMT